MTEAKWLAGSDPEAMLMSRFGKASDRKVRLFGCACCRRVWRLLTEESLRKAVQVAERCADGVASHKELAEAKKRSGEVYSRIGSTGLSGRAYSAAGSAWSATRNPESAAIYPLWVFTNAADRRWQVNLLHDIFGNPFRPARFKPRWRTTDVRALAAAIYEDRAFDRLPVLADSLMDAGCEDEAIVAHCRSPGPHVRGCWVIDLILGKT